MYNDAEIVTSTVTAITGITTDATHNVQLRCATGQSFKDTAGVALDYNTTNGVAMRCTADNVICLDVHAKFTTINGIQFKHSGTGYARIALYCASTGSGDGEGAVISQCIMRGGGNAPDRAAVQFSGELNQKLTNCLIIGNDAAAHGLYLGTATANAITITACTIVKDTTTSATGSIGVTVNYGAGTHIIKGCAVFGFATNFGSTYAAASGRNGTDAGSAPGSNNVVSLTYANQFMATTNDFRLKAGNGLEALSAQYTETGDVDIKGQTRGATPDIGAWEVVSASTVDPRILTGSATIFGLPGLYLK